MAASLVKPYSNASSFEKKRKDDAASNIQKLEMITIWAQAFLGLSAL